MGCGSSSSGKPEPQGGGDADGKNPSSLPSGLGALPNAADLLRDMANCKSDGVVPLLHLGNRNGASDQKLLTELGIVRIVNATKIPPFFPGRFTYHNVRIDDQQGVDIEPHLQDAAEFIRGGIDVGDAVFVHCEMGMSRSTSMVLAYLMIHRGWSLRRALLHTKLARPIVRVTRAFVHALADMEYALAENGDLDAALLGQEGVQSAAEGLAHSLRLLCFPSPALVEDWRSGGRRSPSVPVERPAGRIRRAPVSRRLSRLSRAYPGGRRARRRSSP
eukprot:TRINITY_DN11784_c0_g1_i2.p1 TRINITY_DN11784_c0_g1~~TRINITY_DN11784_c0_g1_i2.p1  ORF type:complete len:275 (+),score=1.21 TRINITY_DN11784_c0_g1_i2:86-910(+)